MAAKCRAKAKAAGSAAKVEDAVVPFEGGEPLLESDDDEQHTPTFSQFMISPKMLVGMMMWLGHVKRAPIELQKALFSIVKTIVAIVPKEAQLDDGLNLAPMVKVDDLRSWLRGHGLEGLWRTKDIAMPFPELLDGHIGGEWLVWFCLRGWKQSDDILGLCKNIVNVFAPLLDEAIAGKAHDSVPQVRLPQGCEECLRKVKLALKGDDKRILAYNNFLARSVGFGGHDDHLLRNFVYDKKLSCYHPFVLKSLVAAYMVKARSVLAQEMAKASGCSGDFLYWDASRVASKEILLVQTWIEGHYISAPLQRLPDQTSVHSPALALGNVSSVILPLSKAPRTSKPRRRDGEATQSLLYAVVQAVKTVVPVENLSVWKPSYIQLGSHRLERKRCAATGHYYWWDSETHEATWCLPPELRVDDVNDLSKVKVRMLVIAADEGSTGWSLFQWLALKHRLRVFWHRDPLHKLSNLFTNSLKATGEVLKVVFRHLVVHKWRRAPFGSGKFWCGLQESLDIAMSSYGPKHPVFEFVYEGIRKDYDNLGMTQNQAWEALREMMREPIGPKVQMRRWYTIWDAGWGIDRMWNSMLFALIVQYALDGSNGFDLASQIIPVVQKGDGKDVQNFKFRQQVLATLFDPYHQRLLRSMLHIFRRVRLHHSSYTEEAKDPSTCLELNQMWASPNRWLAEMVVPSMKDGLTDPKVAERLMFNGQVTGVAAGLRSTDAPELDDAKVLLYHTRLVFDMADQMLQFAIQPQSPLGAIVDCSLPLATRMWTRT